MYVKVCQAVMCNCKFVLFNSFNGKSYSDNPRAISEKLHELYPEIKIKWIINEENRKSTCCLPNYVDAVDGNNRFDKIKALATARVYVDNFSIPLISKSKKQLFIQTWHGDRAFKKVLYAAENHNPNVVISESHPGYCDYAIAGSKYGENQYRTAFKYGGTVLLNGTPRNDILVNATEETIQEYRKRIADNDCKLLLYAPTLRDVSIKNKDAIQKIDTLDISKTLDFLEKKDECKWMCLLRAHPAVAKLSGANMQDERIVDVSSYEDMSHLLLVSDMLITDYSSCAGDFALMERPLILFHSDIEEYTKTSRTFYFSVDESPYFIAKTQSELEDIISGLDEINIKNNCREILNFYDTTESGKASETVANIINDWITKK